jgi:hypothetical protein
MHPPPAGTFFSEGEQMIRRNSEHGLPELLPVLRRTWQRLCAWERRQAGLDQSLSAEERPQGEATFGVIEIARQDGAEFRSLRLKSPTQCVLWENPALTNAAPKPFIPRFCMNLSLCG